MRVIPFCLLNLIQLEQGNLLEVSALRPNRSI